MTRLIERVMEQPGLFALNSITCREPVRGELCGPSVPRSRAPARRQPVGSFCTGRCSHAWGRAHFQKFEMKTRVKGAQTGQIRLYPDEPLSDEMWKGPDTWVLGRAEFHELAELGQGR
ncbi:hypothetical protein NDU88_008778 [Pleurodeles waltl]|uniref:Uncharacterized protein n=1 Tax=Pleurodeles waltl TaxID=8319 RepID=A0AAV7N9V0_PLEWA|nr:hypothetical protein NDU88_008778 [Pleurodeles waltl]